MSKSAQNDKTSLSSAAARKMVEQTLLIEGIVFKGVEVIGKTIKVTVDNDSSGRLTETLGFAFWLDAGLLDYTLKVIEGDS